MYNKYKYININKIIKLKFNIQGLPKQATIPLVATRCKEPDR